MIYMYIWLDLYILYLVLTGWTILNMNSKKDQQLDQLLETTTVQWLEASGQVAEAPSFLELQMVAAPSLRRFCSCYIRHFTTNVQSKTKTPETTWASMNTTHSLCFCYCQHKGAARTIKDVGRLWWFLNYLIHLSWLFLSILHSSLMFSHACWPGSPRFWAAVVPCGWHGYCA